MLDGRLQGSRKLGRYEHAPDRAVTYTPPAGWVEPKATRDGEGHNPLGVFHSRNDCRNIRRSDQLRAVEKPYSAARCMLCASER